MKLTVLDCEQNSAAWHKAKMGMPSSSSFKDVMAEGKGYTRSLYMRKLAGEAITGRPRVNYSNRHMDRGREHEPIILKEYAFFTSEKLERVGFIHNGIAGCSPDSLIGSDGAVDAKSALPHIFVEIMNRDGFPPEHKAQCQGILWITGRKWIDLAVGCADETTPYLDIPIFTVRAFRNESYISELERECIRFKKELAAMVAQLKAKR